MLWSWGSNEFGELGTSDAKARIYPNPVTSLKKKQISKIVCGGQFVISIGQDKSSANKFSKEQTQQHRSLE